MEFSTMCTQLVTSITKTEIDTCTGRKISVAVWEGWNKTEYEEMETELEEMF
jgi:hypothetical protein